MGKIRHQKKKTKSKPKVEKLPDVIEENDDAVGFSYLFFSSFRSFKFYRKWKI